MNTLTSNGVSYPELHVVKTRQRHSYTDHSHPDGKIHKWVVQEVVDSNSIKVRRWWVGDLIIIPLVLFMRVAINNGEKIGW